MTMFKQLSIIVISYNRRELLKRCLGSILNLSTKIDFEVIVVDQSSEDGSIGLVEEYMKKDRHFRLDIFPKKSLNAKRNRGLKLAQSPIVGFVDDDCVLDKDWVNVCFEAFKKDRDIYIVTGRILPLNKGFKRSVRISTKSKIWGKRWFDRVICWRCGCGNNFAVHKHIVDKIGKFDEVIGAGTTLGGGGDDTEYFYRALVNGYNIKYVPEMLVYHPQPTSFEEYRKRSEFYYEGVAIFVKKKYLRYPSAILMVIIRLLHSLVFLVFGYILLKRNVIKVRLAEIKATLRGLKIKEKDAE